jgi:phenylalanine-4-hydroxylase
VSTPASRVHPDHPGFHDPGYQAQREAIAQLALAYRGGPIPHVDYGEQDHGVWRLVCEHLAPLHAKFACRAFREASASMALDPTRIPQLEQVNARLRAATGFSMQPVAEVASGQTFLQRLGDREFPSTRFIRHADAPLITPEPDIVHELIGHACLLTNPDIARVSQLLGRAAQRADADGVQALSRVYWFSLEFGAVEEDGEVKAVGAGLLSSPELEHFRHDSWYLPWDLPHMASTPYRPNKWEDRVFVAPSFARFVADLEAWVAQWTD